MLSLINNILLALCLSVGFFVGYNFRNNKSFEMPEALKHPRKYVKTKIKTRQDMKQIREETDYLNSVLYNIEQYDGTGEGQITIKRGGNN